MRRFVCILLTVLVLAGITGCTKKAEVSSPPPVPERTRASGADSDLAYVGTVAVDMGDGIYEYRSVKSNGEVEAPSLWEYGTQRITADGTRAVYKSAQEDGSYNLYCKTAEGEPFLIAENVNSFYLDSKTGFVIAGCADGVYYSDDATYPLEKVAAYSEADFDNLHLGKGWKYGYYSNDKNELFSVSTDKYEVSPLGITCIPSICHETDTYVFTMADGSGNKGYFLKGDGTFTEVDVTAYSPSGKILTGSENGVEFSQFLSKSGKRIDVYLSDTDAKYYVCSDNEKYLLALQESEGVLCRYDISDVGLTNQIVFDGNFAQCRNTLSVYNQGDVIAQDALGENGEPTLNLYKAGELFASYPIKGGKYSYVNNVLYCLSDNALTKYKPDGTSEAISMNVVDFEVLGEICFYVTKEGRTLYKEGSTTSIAQSVAKLCR